MDFRLSEDQELLVDGVRDFLNGTHGPERLRALDVGNGRDPAMWNGLVEMGLAGLLVPADHGGLGLGLVEGALIAVQYGRAGVSEPIVDTGLVAVPWLLAKGQADRLEEIAAGTLKIALAHPSNPWIADLDQAQAVIANGALAPVPDGAAVAVETVDPLRRLFRPLGNTAADDTLLDLGALMTAAQALGAAEAMLTQAVEYAKTRTQFGQPIGAFQAVKHMLASGAVATAFARPVLLRAAYALQHAEPNAAVHVSHAKLAACDAAWSIAETAIQVHGAMGYTYEVDLHFWMKRAWALAGAWGDRTYHLARLDGAIIGGGMPIGAAVTFA